MLSAVGVEHADDGDRPILGNGGHDVLRRSPAAALHARYGDHRAIVAIDTLEILAGTLPPRSLSLILNASGARG